MPPVGVRAEIRSGAEDKHGVIARARSARIRARAGVGTEGNVEGDDGGD